MSKGNHWEYQDDDLMRTLMILIGVWAGALSTQTPHDP
ncbi:MAG: hypothetical protein ACI9ND_001987, partial [Yoonia sp.]